MSQLTIDSSASVLRSRLCCEARLVADALGAYEVLKQATDLSPNNPAVCEALSGFVADILIGLQLGARPAKVLGHPQVRRRLPELREMLAASECQMERYWAQRISTAADANSELQRFPYLDNYKALTEAEAELIDVTCADRVRRVVVIGSGPLPLTAIYLANKVGVEVLCVDSDELATQRAQRVIRSLGYDDRLTTVTSRGEDFRFMPGDLVFMAALTQNKGAVADLARRRGAELIVVRDAEGLVQLLYEPIRDDSFGQSPVVELGRTSLCAERLNTTVIVQAPSIRLPSGQPHAAEHDLAAVAAQ